MKKVSLYDDNNVEKAKRQPNFHTGGAQIRYAYFTNKSMILLVYKEVYLNTKNLKYVVSNVVLLQEYDDLFLRDISSGLPSIRRIEHQSDLSKALIPNCLAYRSTPRRQKSIKGRSKS